MEFQFDDLRHIFFKWVGEINHHPDNSPYQEASPKTRPGVQFSRRCKTWTDCRWWTGDRGKRRNVVPRFPRFPSCVGVWYYVHVAFFGVKTTYKEKEVSFLQCFWWILQYLTISKWDYKPEVLLVSFHQTNTSCWLMPWRRGRRQTEMTIW